MFPTLSKMYLDKEDTHCKHSFDFPQGGISFQYSICDMNFLFGHIIFQLSTTYGFENMMLGNPLTAVLCASKL